MTVFIFIKDRQGSTFMPKQLLLSVPSQIMRSHIICHDLQELFGKMAKCDNSLIYKNRKNRELLQ